ncbi:MAG: type II toxin-antitoxin system death-on-curing family toxin [Betaproteobacteria bacterium]|nr:type II toxin-antitoxin system death-on-curing family toxin [Betaproteobacteria bacterium]
MKRWVWLAKPVLDAVHQEQLAEHGGPAGVRDASLRESAMARPRHLSAYGKPDIAALAAAYGWGLARNHPFVDGNKRTAFVAVELFLDLNGHELTADDAGCVVTMLQVAAGDLDEPAFAAWIRAHLAARTPPT